MTIKITEEQQAIINAATETADNLRVEARAGAAKTTTLVLVAEALPDVEMLCLAFNKKIALEMSERLPENCTAKTLHSLGYSAWGRFLRRQCRYTAGKTYHLLKAHIEDLRDEQDRKDAYETFAETLKVIEKGKQIGWVPASFKGFWKSTHADEDFFLSLPQEITDLQKTLVEEVSAASFKQALKGDLDFDDMILCPAISPVSWPTYPLTLLDEAQDLSPLNHRILKKLVRNNRIIAVGDSFQAIYGFRGASENSMNVLSDMFNMKTLFLTTSFRCAKAVCENVRWRAPDMAYPEWAKAGKVVRLTQWGASDIQAGDAIICRNNAPLFGLAIRLLRDGHYPEIIGRDIGKGLKAIMKKLGKAKQVRLAALAALDEWRDKELVKCRQGAAWLVNDKHACIQIILNQTDTIGEAIKYLDDMLTRRGRVFLMTGHKAKGLEYNRVFFLDQGLCKVDKDQDANIKYVIETRAKETLYYVELDDYDTEFLEEAI